MLDLKNYMMNIRKSIVNKSPVKTGFFSYYIVRNKEISITGIRDDDYISLTDIAQIKKRIERE